MPRITLEQVQNLADPLLSDMYKLQFGPIPSATGQGNTGSNNTLSIQCQQCSIPSKTVEPVEVALAGTSLMFAGRVTFSHDLSITFVENNQLVIYKTLDGWANYCRDKKTQIGHLKRTGPGYSTDAKLHVYDQTGNNHTTFKLFNVWCNTVPEIQFDSSAANLITIAASFQYDYWEIENGSDSSSYN